MRGGCVYWPGYRRVGMAGTSICRVRRSETCLGGGLLVLDTARNSDEVVGVENGFGVTGDRVADIN